jgi:hypothetical protein
MSYLKLRITLNRGNRGIALDKLEHVVQEVRKFLVSVGEDMQLVEPSSWAGVDFKNSSLEFVNEYQLEVPEPKLARFNDAIIALGRSEFPPSLRESTSNQFLRVADCLGHEEVAELAVFAEDGTPITLHLSKRTALLARLIDVLPFREALGAIQGTIHSLYKESRPTHFMLRELSTGDLVKCLYEKSEYPAVVQALRVPDQVLHVSGTVVTDTRERCIKHIRVKEIVLAEPYGFEDVEKFLRGDATQ